MGHSMIDINSKTLAIVALLLVGAFVAVYVFNVSWSTVGTVALIGSMVWMHGGMHGGHGSHGSDPSRDEHAGHPVEPTRDDNAKTIAPDANARGLASDEKAKSTAREESHRHGCC